jgi:hypothetical protein
MLMFPSLHLFISLESLHTHLASVLRRMPSNNFHTHHAFFHQNVQVPKQPPSYATISVLETQAAPIVWRRRKGEAIQKGDLYSCGTVVGPEYSIACSYHNLRYPGPRMKAIERRFECTSVGEHRVVAVAFWVAAH